MAKTSDALSERKDFLRAELAEGRGIYFSGETVTDPARLEEILETLPAPTPKADRNAHNFAPARLQAADASDKDAEIARLKAELKAAKEAVSGGGVVFDAAKTGDKEPAKK